MTRFLLERAPVILLGATLGWLTSFIIEIAFPLGFW